MVSAERNHTVLWQSNIEKDFCLGNKFNAKADCQWHK